MCGILVFYNLDKDKKTEEELIAKMKVNLTMGKENNFLKLIDFKSDYDLFFKKQLN
mgnify:CR=1 FL=1|tara:strand:+ start:497 stop:664 length:168 start_codon:yes stop_codon:yes gene_type:complete